MRVLILTSHIGLGHVTRDWRIAEEIRKVKKNVKIEWITAEPALTYLESRGEHVLSVSKELKSFSNVVEDLFNLRLHNNIFWLKDQLKLLESNYFNVISSISLDSYDILIADEFWELIYRGKEKELGKFLFITDFLYKPYGVNITNSIGSLILNKFLKKRFETVKKLVYIGMPEEIPLQRWYLLAGERVREWAYLKAKFVGKVPSLDIDQIPSKSEARKKLGLGGEIVITASIGGTRTLAREFIDKVKRACYMMKGSVKDIKLLVLSGPRYRFKSNDMVVGIDFTPDGWLYLAASDLTISRSGRTTVTDIEVLGIPAILVPIPGHFEQEAVAHQASKVRSNIKVLDEGLSPSVFAKVAINMIGARESPKDVKAYEGAKRVALTALNYP